MPSLSDFQALLASLENSINLLNNTRPNQQNTNQNDADWNQLLESQQNLIGSLDAFSDRLNNGTFLANNQQQATSQVGTILRNTSDMTNLLQSLQNQGTQPQPQQTDSLKQYMEAIRTVFDAQAELSKSQAQAIKIHSKEDAKNLKEQTKLLKAQIAAINRNNNGGMSKIKEVLTTDMSTFFPTFFDTQADKARKAQQQQQRQQAEILNNEKITNAKASAELNKSRAEAEAIRIRAQADANKMAAESQLKQQQFAAEQQEKQQKQQQRQQQQQQRQQQQQQKQQQIDAEKRSAEAFELNTAYPKQVLYEFINTILNHDKSTGSPYTAQTIQPYADKLKNDLMTATPNSNSVARITQVNQNQNKAFDETWNLIKTEVLSGTQGVPDTAIGNAMFTSAKNKVSNYINTVQQDPEKYRKQYLQLMKTADVSDQTKMFMHYADEVIGPIKAEFIKTFEALGKQIDDGNGKIRYNTDDEFNNYLDDCKNAISSIVVNFGIIEIVDDIYQEANAVSQFLSNVGDRIGNSQVVKSLSDKAKSTIQKTNTGTVYTQRVKEAADAAWRNDIMQNIIKTDGNNLPTKKSDIADRVKNEVIKWCDEHKNKRGEFLRSINAMTPEEINGKQQQPTQDGLFDRKFDNTTGYIKSVFNDTINKMITFDDKGSFGINDVDYKKRMRELLHNAITTIDAATFERYGSTLTESVNIVIVDDIYQEGISDTFQRIGGFLNQDVNTVKTNIGTKFDTFIHRGEAKRYQDAIQNNVVPDKLWNDIKNEIKQNTQSNATDKEIFNTTRDSVKKYLENVASDPIKYRNDFFAMLNVDPNFQQGLTRRRAEREDQLNKQLNPQPTSTQNNQNNPPQPNGQNNSGGTPPTPTPNQQPTPTDQNDQNNPPTTSDQQTNSNNQNDIPQPNPTNQNDPNTIPPDQQVNPGDQNGTNQPTSQLDQQQNQPQKNQQTYDNIKNTITNQISNVKNQIIDGLKNAVTTADKINVLENISSSIAPNKSNSTDQSQQSTTNNNDQSDTETTNDESIGTEFDVIEIVDDIYQEGLISRIKGLVGKNSSTGKSASESNWFEPSRLIQRIINDYNKNVSTKLKLSGKKTTEKRIDQLFDEINIDGLTTQFYDQNIFDTKKIINNINETEIKPALDAIIDSLRNEDNDIKSSENLRLFYQKYKYIVNVLIPRYDKLFKNLKNMGRDHLVGSNTNYYYIDFLQHVSETIEKAMENRSTPEGYKELGRLHQYMEDWMRHVKLDAGIM